MVRLPSKAFRRTPVPVNRGLDSGESSPFCTFGSVETLMSSRGAEQIPELFESLHLSDNYDVEEAILGQGGFGTVRRAWNRMDGTLCAVKAVPTKDRHFENMARNETRILRLLDHAHICRLMHVFKDFGHIHLVLEFADGHELYEEVAQRQPMKEARAAAIIKQVAEALQYCHERAVIHRDVKLENIMVADVGPSGRIDVKVLDWGLATVCLDRVQTGRVGTAVYLAPESVREGMYSRSSDMWSVGVVLYALLTGGDFPKQDSQLGFSRNDSLISLHELEITASGENLLNGLLNFAPSERLSASDALVHRWTIAHAGQPLSFEQKLTVPGAHLRHKASPEQSSGFFHNLESVADATPSTDYTRSWPSIANSCDVSVSGAGELSLDLGTSNKDFDVYVDNASTSDVDASICELVYGPHSVLSEDTSCANSCALDMHKGTPCCSDTLLRKPHVFANLDQKENFVPEMPLGCKLSVEALPRQPEASPKPACASNAVHSKVFQTMPFSNCFASLR